MLKVLAAPAGLAFASLAMAIGNVSFSSNGGVIPDNGGSMGNVFTSEVWASIDEPFVIQGILFNGLVHSRVGDPSMTLTGPGEGNSFNFSYRPGQTTPTSDGQDAAFAAGSFYRFYDGRDPWYTGEGDVPSGWYEPVRSIFAPVQPVNSFGELVGEPGGTWTLTIADYAEGNRGHFNSWTMVVKTVPAPASTAVLGLAGVAAIRRRR